MLLILVRHGIAIDRLDPACPPDPQRALTERGLRRTRAAAAGLMRLLGEPVDRIVSSPWLRARQTADILAEAAGLSTVAESHALLPWSDPQDLLDELRGSTGVVLATGHAPHLDGLVANLAGAREDFTWLKKSGACAFDLSGPTPLMRFLAQPRTLRRLA